MCVSVCVWTPYMCPEFHGGQKRALDGLKLVLQVVVSHFVGSGNQTWVFCKSGKCCWLLSHLVNPLWLFFIRSTIFFLGGFYFPLISPLSQKKCVCWVYLLVSHVYKCACICGVQRSTSGVSPPSFPLPLFYFLDCVFILCTCVFLSACMCFTTHMSGTQGG